MPDDLGEIRFARGADGKTWVLRGPEAELIEGATVRVAKKDGGASTMIVGAIQTRANGYATALVGGEVKQGKQRTLAPARADQPFPLGPVAEKPDQHESPPVESEAQARTAWEAAYAALDPYQKQVADLTLAPDRIFRVFAGAGSGKTTAVTALAAKLLASGAADPKDTYLITFTKLGGKELREKLGKQLHGALFRQVYDKEDPRIGTYDAFTHRFTRELTKDAKWSMGRNIDFGGGSDNDVRGKRGEDEEAGPRTENKHSSAQIVSKLVNGDFNKALPFGAFQYGATVDLSVRGTIAQEEDKARAEQRTHVQRGGSKYDSVYKDLESRLADLDELKDHLGVRSFRSVVTRMRGWRADREEALAMAAEVGLPFFEKILDHYEAVKRVEQTWEFVDAMEEAIRRLKARPRPVNPRRLVIVDEAQDNTPIQIEFARELARGGTLVMVGDVRQAIFEWRAAAPHLYADETALSKDGSKVETLYLANNYRSGSRIVAAGNAIAAGKAKEGSVILPRDAFDWNLGKPSIAKRATEGRVIRDGDGAPGVLAQVQRYIAAGNPLHEIAVLARKNVELAQMELEFHKAAIPVQIAGAGSFFNTTEWRLYESMLVAAYQQGRDVQDTRVKALTEDAFPRVGKGSFDNVVAHMQQGHDLARALAHVAEDTRNKRGKAILNALAARVGRLYTRAAEVRAADEAGTPDASAWASFLFEARVAISYVFGYSDSGEPLQDDDAKLRRADKADFLSSSNDDDATSPVSPYCDCELIAGTKPALVPLAQFVNDSRARVTKAHEEGSKAKIEAVTLSTIHKAKGLEWGLVAVLATAGSFPIPIRPADAARMRPITLRSVETLARTRAEQNPLKPQPDWMYRGEERRLFYVACTRAKDILYLTYAKLGGGNSCMAAPIRGGAGSATSGNGTPSPFLRFITEDIIGGTRDVVLVPEEPDDEEEAETEVEAEGTPDDAYREDDEADDPAGDHDGDDAAPPLPPLPPPPPLFVDTPPAVVTPPRAKTARELLLEDDDEDSDEDDDDVATGTNPAAKKLIARLEATYDSRLDRTASARDPKVGRTGAVVRAAEVLHLLSELGPTVEDAALSQRGRQRVWRLQVGTVASVAVYSSIPVGEQNSNPIESDSIKVVLLGASGRPLAGRAAHVKRTKGWRQSLATRIHELLLMVPA